MEEDSGGSHLAYMTAAGPEVSSPLNPVGMLQGEGGPGLPPRPV